jgi:hypothetical protein
VRRLPIVDADGVLVGIFSLSDLARNLCFAHLRAGNSDSSMRMASLMEAVSRPRVAMSRGLVMMTEEEKEYVAQFESP